MRSRKFLRNILATVSVAVMALTGALPAAAQSDGLLHGWFSVVWGDDRVGFYAPAPVVTLAADDGRQIPLLVDESVASAAGGLQALNGRRVSLRGTQRVAPPEMGGQVSIEVTDIFVDAQEAGGAQPEVSGAQPFISIMCKFAGDSSEPENLAYFQNMYGSAYPGLDNYWRQTSYNTVNIVGSTAVGWYTLPHNHTYYMSGNSFNLYQAAADCTGVANAAVNFSGFLGINMMFNANLDDFAWGGRQCMTLDGVNKCWPMTWEPPWGYADIAVISHEMGHAFGLPHSSGNYGQTYDNQWDVMSDNWSNCGNSSDATYGCLGQSTISYHKDILGWIPPARKFTAGAGTEATITLEQLTLPGPGGYLMAKIPINGSSSHFYTVEVRRLTGYDVKLPLAAAPNQQAVIIHDVLLGRLNPAHVIDASTNGNTGDLGAMWTVGETFSAGGITVKVLSATASGFQVHIHTPGGSTSSTATFTSNAANDGWVLESGPNSGAGGSMDSAALTFNLGDNAANREYRALLHFDTSTLPDNAVITKATLRILKQGLAGTNPFNTHGILRADIRKLFFGTAASLQLGDFNATASNGSAALFGAAPAGSWYSATLTATGRSLVNRTGATQFRLHFTLDDNNDLGADAMRFYSGNAAAANRPQLVVIYH